MDLNIALAVNNNQITVTDLSTTYLSEDNTNILLNQFRKSDTSSLIIVTVNKTSGEEVLTTSFGNTVTITEDGWLTINYIVLPTKEWFDSIDTSLLGIYDIVYYIYQESIYSYSPKTGVTEELVSTDDLLNILDSTNLKTTISSTSVDQVSIYKLQKCYLNLCQQIFESRAFSSCWNKNNIDSELIYKRDLAWMALNVIKYMVECNQLYEAERLIETFHSCNGICNDSNSTTNVSGCGCS